MTVPVTDVAMWVEDGRPAIEHVCVGGERVIALLNNAQWRMASADPLTVEPSVACARCGLHGWISEGQFWGTPGRRVAA